MMPNYFRKEEFACSCCGLIHISDALISQLNIARYIARTPFIITSGYRCEDHNKAIGAVSTSSHVKGLAVDIRTKDSTERYKVLNGLITVGFNRIGIGKDFIHVDIDTTKPKGVIWGYK